MPFGGAVRATVALQLHNSQCLCDGLGRQPRFVAGLNDYLLHVNMD